MSAAPFAPQEATIAGIHAAYRAGTLSATALVEACLARIEAYDRQGPALRSLLLLNPHAPREAQRLDAAYRAQGGPTGPLHGIPVIIKDNFDTKDMPTSGGNIAMRASQPRTDATTVERLRAAGAILLAKSNLQEFARGGLSISSLGGQTLNPYDLTRTPGGAPAAAPARPSPPASPCSARAATPASRSARPPRPAAWSACGPPAAS